MEYQLSEDKIPIFEWHYNEGYKLSEGLILLKGKTNPKLGFFRKRKAKKAIKHFLECLKLIPNHWQTNWTMGKIYQALSEHEQALYHFERAIEVEKEDSALPREASISAMKAGKIELALKYSLEALNLDPNDAGLHCNHAVNLMVSGNDEDALKWINRSIKMESGDKINKDVFDYLNNIKNGSIRRPKYYELP